MSTLGETITETRHTLGMTAKELATALDLSPQYLSDIERGNRHPTDDALLLKTATTLYLSSDYVYYLAGIIPPDIRERQATEQEVITAFNEFRHVIRERQE